MSTSIDRREVAQRSDLRSAARECHGRRATSALRDHRGATPRLMGLPIAGALPGIRGIEWYQIGNWYHRPLAAVGKRLVQHGHVRPSQWNGQVFDLVETGFRECLQRHGLSATNRVWSGSFDLSDCIGDSYDPRMEDGGEDLPYLFLTVDYSSAAFVPMAATLEWLENRQTGLAAAFYVVFTRALQSHMRVYDYDEATQHAEYASEGMEQEELQQSFYPDVETSLPDCLRDRPARETAVRFLKRMADATYPEVKELIASVLQMHLVSQNLARLWKWQPEGLPNLDDMGDFDSPVPGCLVCWQEDDPIYACFDEYSANAYEVGPMPNLCLPIPLNWPTQRLERRIDQVLEMAALVVECLAAATPVIETIREQSDEHLRQHRRQSTPSPPAGTADLRDDRP